MLSEAASQQLTPWQASSSAAYARSQGIQSTRKWATQFFLVGGVYTKMVVCPSLAVSTHWGRVGTCNSCTLARLTLRFFVELLFDNASATESNATIASIGSSSAASALLCESPPAAAGLVSDVIG